MENASSIIEIDLTALEKNLAVIKAALRPSTSVVAIVKADAYGHGAVPVAQKLEALGVNWFGVTNLCEAIQLREAGIKANILLLGGFKPEEAKEVIDHQLIPFVSDFDCLKELGTLAKNREKKLKLHLKVDTGMGRLGFLPQEAKKALEFIQSCPFLEVDGIGSHFSTADEDLDYALEQLERFQTFLSELPEGMCDRPKRHMANSAAIFTLPQSHFEMVRPGISLYGLHPSLDFKRRLSLPLEPVMSWKTYVAEVKELPVDWGVSYGRTFVTKRRTRVAVLPVGYADGYLRSLSNKAHVLIKGKRAPVIGRVTMDWTMVDVTDLTDVKKGDEVLLFGKELTAEELADQGGTIPYEITCLAGRRAKRMLKDERVDHIGR